MPLRDHFHSHSGRSSWDVVHGAWPTVMAFDLNRRLPERYVAGPRVHLGSMFELDVATSDRYWDDLSAAGSADEGGGVATMVQAPPEPTLAVATGMPGLDEYEVLIEDTLDGRLVAVVEIVSPANKDRPESRRAFVAKCGSLMVHNVCVAIVDPVTDRTANLYRELLAFFGVADPTMAEEPPPIYAVACRWRKKRPAGFLEAWAHPLEIGRALPSLPLWLDPTTWIALDLEATYDETCRNLRIP